MEKLCFLWIHIEGQKAYGGNQGILKKKKNRRYYFKGRIISSPKARSQPTNIPLHCLPK